MAALPPQPLALQNIPVLKGMALIPKGEFWTGRSSDKKMTLDNEFHMDQYEVTQQEFERVMDKTPPDLKARTGLWNK